MITHPISLSLRAGIIGSGDVGFVSYIGRLGVATVC